MNAATSGVGAVSRPRAAADRVRDGAAPAEARRSAMLHLGGVEQAKERVRSARFGAFAGLAQLLAALGTYGVLSFVVVERRREIGIRVAIGATRGSIVALVTKQGLLIVSIGLAAGLAGALGLNRLLASLLFGVAPTDLATLAAVMSTIAVVAALACGLPAWRASRLDPNVVLRAG